MRFWGTQDTYLVEEAPRSKPNPFWGGIAGTLKDSISTPTFSKWNTTIFLMGTTQEKKNKADLVSTPRPIIAIPL